MSDKEETENNDETLELDEHGYPRLPDDVMEFRLSKKKGIVRQLMGAARRRFDFVCKIHMFLNKYQVHRS